MLATRMAVSERGRICDCLVSHTFTHLLLLLISRVVIAAIEGTRNKWMRVASISKMLELETDTDVENSEYLLVEAKPLNF